MHSQSETHIHTNWFFPDGSLCERICFGLNSRCTDLHFNTLADKMTYLQELLIFLPHDCMRVELSMLIVLLCLYRGTAFVCLYQSLHHSLPVPCAGRVQVQTIWVAHFVRVHLSRSDLTAWAPPLSLYRGLTRWSSLARQCYSAEDWLMIKESTKLEDYIKPQIKHHQQPPSGITLFPSEVMLPLLLYHQLKILYGQFCSEVCSHQRDGYHYSFVLWMSK